MFTHAAGALKLLCLNGYVMVLRDVLCGPIRRTTMRDIKGADLGDEEYLLQGFRG